MREMRLRRDASMIKSGAVWLLLAVSACFHPSYDRPACGPDGTCPDGLRCSDQLICEAGAPLDAAEDVGPATDGASLDGNVPPLCLGAFVNVCVDPPQSPVALLTQTIDTTSSPLCAAYTSIRATEACVIAGQSISIPAGSTVTVIGSKKLILLSGSSITISGVLDAASHQGKPSGPAADAGPCPTTGFTSPAQGVQGGGGWGASFGTSGNNGGNVTNGTGGIPPVSFAAIGLRAGCPGSDGGGNLFGSGGGARGHGGGAVLLLATQTLSIDGTVNASGAGGHGANSGLGGGGGGAGGMIVLDAAAVNVAGQCFANGGGGGEGGGGNGGLNGGESVSPASRGGGGKGGTADGGDGGGGAFGATGSTAGDNGSANGANSGGGGGGGGGVGVIKIIAPSQFNTNDPAHVSPAPS
jgi:hypothetical protein